MIKKTIETFEILSAVVFGDLVIHTEVQGQSFKSANKKEGAVFAMLRGLLWVEVSIYPLEQMIGEGSVNAGENKACDLSCDFHNRNRARTGVGKCYVDGSKLGGFQRKALTLLEAPRAKNARVLRQGGYILRLTRWGDISRLNNEGLRYILSLVDLAAETRAYSNIWRHETEALEAGDLERWRLIQSLKGKCQASVSNPQDALTAARLGWKVYAGARQCQIKEALLNAGERPVFKCPYVEDGAIACSNCPMPCDGTKHILAPLH